MTSFKKKKRKSNNSFLLAVILMVSLIVTILVPTAMAWFTDSDTGSSGTSINFGTVNINVEQNNDGNANVEFTNLNSPARALETVLPGDRIEFSFNVINTGSVDTYAKVSFAPKIMYGETDITPLLYDTTTDPINQPYWIVDNTNNTTDNPDFYTDGDPNNQVFVLATGEAKQIKGVLQFKTTLPNSVTDGTNPPYQLNGHEEGIVKLVLDIDMAAIQKDNIILTDAVTELNKHVDSMAINYSFTYLNGNPTLTVAGKPVETDPPYEVGATEDTKAYAFVKEINGEKTLLAVVGEGSMQDYNNTNEAPWKDARSNITDVVIEDEITTIGAYAFYNCYNLTNVIIPNSVKSIGSNAFDRCTSLTSIVIPNSVQSIGDHAFWYCSSLTSVVIGDSVQSIGSGAFWYCSSIDSITVESRNTKYHSENNCLIETDTNTLILGCKNSIIPNYITSIGEDAFCDCTSLTSVVIPDSVQSIGSGAFCGCSSIDSITVESRNTKYHSENNCLIETDTNTLILGCKNSIIPNYITSIGDYAFDSCTSLTSIVIPNSVQSIGDSAFGYCSSLTSVVIPDSVQSIGYVAFGGFTSNQTIFMEHSSTSEIANLDRRWLGACKANVYWYSETEKAGCWHYVNNTPVLW